MEFPGRRRNDALFGNKVAMCTLCFAQIGNSKTRLNDGAKFRESALQYLDGLYGYAMTLTHNEAEAEDLVQETYLRAVPAFGQLRPDSNLKSWLFTILRNVRLNQLRQSKSKPRVVEINEPVSGAWEFEDKSSKDPFVSYLTKVKQADMRKAIENLPAAYREVIVLREFEELSYGEIAEVLDCPPGTVMSRLSRAREKLKKMLQQWSTSEAASGSG
jgi:RNA polymerase sigma-70 factor (ECF subfamily)